MEKTIVLKENANEAVEKKGKINKKIILIGAGGALLVVGGFLIGKKIGKGSVIGFSRQLGDVARDIKVMEPIPLPEGTTKLWKEIDEQVFTEIAPMVENTLIDLHIDELHLDRSWEVAEGVTKTLKVTVDTVKA